MPAQRAQNPGGNQAAQGLCVAATIIGSSVQTSRSPDGYRLRRQLRLRLSGQWSTSRHCTHQITSSRAISEIGGLVTRVSARCDADRATVSEDVGDRVVPYARMSSARSDRPAVVRIESPTQYLYIAD